MTIDAVMTPSVTIAISSVDSALICGLTPRRTAEKILIGSVVAEGVVSFDEAGLDVGQQRLSWSEVLVLVVEVASQLQVRTEGRLMRLEIPGQSPLKWVHFMRPHWQAVRNP